MYYFVAILFSVLISFAAFAQADASTLASVRPKIQVHANTTLDSKSIMLGQIATFVGFEESEQTFLTNISLGDAPSPGKQLHFTSRGVADVFRKYLEELPRHSKRNLGFGNVQLEIPGSVNITGMHFEITAQEVQAQIMRFQTEKCADCKFKIISLNLPNMKAIAKGAEWKIRWPNEMLRGSFQLAIEVNDMSEGAGPALTFWASGEVRTLRKVAVLSRSLNADERVQATDVTFDWRDVTFSQDNPVTVEKMVGSKLRRNLMANQILWMSDLAREMACKNGDPVELQLAGGDWSVSLRAIAKDNGFIGDVIKVLNPTTNKILSGVVKAKGVVEAQ